MAEARDRKALEHEDFGQKAKIHPASFVPMSKPRKGNMGNAFEMLNMASSHPFVFSTSGAMGREATTFYKRLADLLSEKQDNA